MVLKMHVKIQTHVKILNCAISDVVASCKMLKGVLITGKFVIYGGAKVLVLTFNDFCISCIYESYVLFSHTNPISHILNEGLILLYVLGVQAEHPSLPVLVTINQANQNSLVMVTHHSTPSHVPGVLCL